MKENNGSKEPKIWKISELEDLILKGRPRCLCFKILSPLGLKMEEHSAGMRIEGENKLQWVYVHCNYCGYDMAYWKIHQEILRNLEADK